MAGPLEGVKILEVAEFLALPSAIAILSDWGAEVIKVEKPEGDGLRFIESIEGVSIKDIHVWWEQTNRNKKSIAVDLWHEEGRAIIYELTKRSDVFVTNFTLPVIERFKIDFGTIRELNPRIIYAHLTGFGSKGPDKDRPGFDYVAFWARSGIMSRLGPPGTQPPTQRGALGDNLTSGFLAGAISSALYSREKTGKGQAIDFSLYNYGVWGLSVDMIMPLIEGEELPRTDPKAVTNPLWNTYQSKDGEWIQFVCLESDRYWPQFCKGLGLDHLEKDPKFESHEMRERNNVELISIIDSAISTKTYDEIETGIEKAGEVIYQKVQTPLQVVNDPQALANDFFTEVEHPSGRKIKLIASPAKFSGTPASIKATAPELGQHTEEVLLELGYSWEDMNDLRDKGVIP
jgi:crotonobetainyl-CoA:carnitine CoA-transferase CaiB-like acyl-CoA transferase